MLFNLLKQIVLSFVLLLPVIVLCKCDSAVDIPILGIELSGGDGFHRDLSYVVQFDYPLAGKECEYVLEQQLPPAVYISVDQLDDLKRLEKLNAIYPKFVNIETPAEKSEAFTVLLKGSPKITDSIKLPIHFRYHAPSDTSTFVDVEIPKPNMYINCPIDDNDDNDDNQILDNEVKTFSKVKYCLQDNSSTFSVHSEDSNVVVNREDCNWRLINVDYHPKPQLNAKIPIGNTKSYPPILWATIVISWFVSLWTVFHTKDVPRRINQKLEEQRVLQNKIK